jgi:hypothetical protein
VRLIPVQVLIPFQSAGSIPHRNFGLSVAEPPRAIRLREVFFSPIFFSEKKMGNLALAAQAPQFR